MKAIAVFRQILGANGTCILHPIGIVANEELAKEMVAHAEGMLRELERCHVTEVTPTGPRGVMPVPQLFAELGITSFKIMTMTADVKETSLIVPRTSPILQ
jgi:hypothetical protein